MGVAVSFGDNAIPSKVGSMYKVLKAGWVLTGSAIMASTSGPPGARAGPVGQTGSLPAHPQCSIRGTPRGASGDWRMQTSRNTHVTSAQAMAECGARTGAAGATGQASLAAETAVDEGAETLGDAVTAVGVTEGGTEKLKDTVGDARAVASKTQGGAGAV